MRRIERRNFLATAAAIAVAPLVRARTRPFRIGLVPEFEELPNFRPELARLFLQLGWREGSDFEFVVTGAKYHTLEIEAATARMVAEKPDLVLAVGTSVASALYRRTHTIPIVMVLSGYPVEAGLAESLARPGKNVTGTTIYAGTGVWAKYLELLRSARPGLKRVGMLMSYTPPGHSRAEIAPVYREVVQGADTLGLQVRIVEIPSSDLADPVLAEIRTWKPEALMLTSGQGAWTVREKLSGLAVSLGVPSISDFPWLGIEPQPLLTYAPEVSSLWRTAITYAVRILRDGVHPGDLPIQQPARFELEVNLKTAKAIGLAVPQSLLLRADRVIQ